MNKQVNQQRLANELKSEVLKMTLLNLKPSPEIFAESVQKIVKRLSIKHGHFVLEHWKTEETYNAILGLFFTDKEIDVFWADIRSEIFTQLAQKDAG